MNEFTNFALIAATTGFFIGVGLGASVYVAEALQFLRDHFVTKVLNRNP